MQLLDRLQLRGAFGDPEPGQFADVAVYKNYAYVNSRLGNAQCDRGGFFVVDVSDPTDAKEVTFVRSLEQNFPGEGAHVITVDTPSFKGDILAVNNEFCSESATVGGGFDLFDVTDPRNPKPLARGVGDTNSADFGVLVDDPAQRSADYHSVFLWQHGGKAYAVGVDNVESSFDDVDIWDITNPAAPAPVREYWLYDLFFDQIDDGNLALGGNYSFLGNVFNHDVTVKLVDGKPIMVVSYWDGGYVLLDVTDPAEAQFVADTSFEGADPEFPQFTPPEGNAHYAEFSHDAKYLLGADEDFAPERITTVTVAGPEGGNFPGSAVGGSAPTSILPDGVLNGPTVYGGYACPPEEGSPGSDPVPQRSAYNFALQPGEEAILVVQRGPTGDPAATEPACFPGQKAEVAINAGWDAVLLVNRHTGDLTVPYCGSGAFPADPPIVAPCASHSALHAIFPDTPPTGAYDAGDTHNPDIGETGEKVSTSSVFDGWGYLHLYRNAPDAEGNLPQIDTFAIPESKDPARATNSGDLSIHEMATDPQHYLAYTAYYSGGTRVYQFGDNGLTETGAYIPPEGANIWGVEQYSVGSRRVIAASDRDFGLYLLQYTGPGAALAPVCENRTASTAFRTPVNVPLACTDANGQTVTLSLATPPRGGTVTINGTTATYTPNTAFAGTDSFAYVGSDGLLTSAPATVTVSVALPAPGTVFFEIACNPLGATIIGTPADDLIRCGNGPDVLDGRGGDDAIFGEGGNDRIRGGTGDDLVEAGDGNDTVDGEDGADVLNGGRGNDRITGGRGNDFLDGVSGRNTLSAGSGHDTIYGGTSADRVSGGSGDDEITAGRGNDRISGGRGEDDIDAGPGNDRVNTRDNKPDIVNCGSGRRDVATIDRRDRTRGCERVIRPKRRR